MVNYIVKNDKVNIYTEQRNDHRWLVFENSKGDHMELMYPYGLYVHFDGMDNKVCFHYKTACNRRRYKTLHVRLYDRLHEFQSVINDIVHSAYGQTDGLIDREGFRRMHLEHYLVNEDNINRLVHDYPAQSGIVVRDIYTGKLTHYTRSTTGMLAARREAIANLKRVAKVAVKLEDVLRSIKVKQVTPVGYYSSNKLRTRDAL